MFEAQGDGSTHMKGLRERRRAYSSKYGARALRCLSLGRLPTAKKG